MTIQKIEKEIATIEKPIAITTPTHLSEAVSDLSKANNLLDALIADRELITKPINQSLKEIRAKYKPAQDRLESFIGSLKQEIARYATVTENARLEAESRISQRVKPGSGNLSIEKAAEKMAALPTVEKNIATEAGAITFIDTIVPVVMDVALLPAPYLLPNMPAIRQALKEGTRLPGVEYRTEKIIRNNR